VCDFPVTAHSEGVLTGKLYYNAGGDVVREVDNVQRSYTITYTNDANGRKISTVLGGPVFYDYFPDGSYTYTIAGHERMFIAKGEGPVASQVGRLTVHVAADGTTQTLFEAGTWDEDLFTAICGYLAG
jgi:hypothetical protein